MEKHRVIHEKVTRADVLYHKSLHEQGRTTFTKSTVSSDAHQSITSLIVAKHLTELK